MQTITPTTAGASVLAPSTPNRAPAILGDVATAVDRRIAEVLDADAARWRHLDPDITAPFDLLRSVVLRGGKRLRPAFCQLSFVGAGGDPADPRIIDAGAALELLHAFALIHDDVMDGSDLRRGAETVHIGVARRHRSQHWRGEPRRFGEGVAVLVGDLAFVYADMLMAGAPAQTVAVFTELRLELTVGQYLDLLGAARGDRSAQHAAIISRYKSGKYTVERPLHLGASLAAPTAAHRWGAPLSAYGLPLGEAFQLTDDLLGVFGDRAVTGKPVGDDLRAGKPTVLYALASELATGSGRRLLQQRYGCPDLTDAEIGDLQAVFELCGARRRIEARIASLLGAARSACRRLPLEPDARARLDELAVFVAGRVA